MVKRIILFFVAALLCASPAPLKRGGLSALVQILPPSSQFCYYIEDYSNAHKFGEDSVRLGSGAIVFTTLGQAQGIKEQVLGESVCVEGSEPQLLKIMEFLHIEVIRQEDVGEIYVVYGYSPMLGAGLCLFKQVVNVQIAFRSNSITVGTPIIIGSY